MVRALNDFEANDEGQVDLEKGEEVQVLGADNKGWTKIRSKNGEKGIVPSVFLGNILKPIGHK